VPADRPGGARNEARVLTADVRGRITSHRARSAIASQLYNAKEPTGYSVGWRRVLGRCPGRPPLA